MYICINYISISMIKVGLSGNRFSGKDKISKIFEDISIPVFDADVIVKFVLNYNYELFTKIKESLGHKYISKLHTLNLNLINEDGKFGKVLSLIEDDVFRAYQNFEDKHKKSIYTVFNSSVLYESKWSDRMDKNITVYAPFIDRVERAKKELKGQYHDRSTINTLLNHEMDELDKNSKGDHVIHNYNEFDVKKTIMQIDQSLINDYLRYENS